MSITFKKAVRENVGLLIGLSGASGSGKTYSAFRLASGIAGGKPFAVIDTESGRALHYADQFTFDHAELRPPFSPDAYAEAIKAADAAGYPVIVVDSFSHSWAGDGGVLDWRENELDEMVKRAMQRNSGAKEWQLRESLAMTSWIKPKTSYKRMMQQLLQVRAHLILCFRAEPKIDIVKDRDGKTKIMPKQSITGLDGWIPVCEKNTPFELTASFMLTADKPGMPQPIKLQQQHKAMIDIAKPLDEEAGKRIAEWAHGGSKKKPEPPADIEPVSADAVIFAFQSCETVEDLKKTAATYEGRIGKADLLPCQEAYKAHLKTLRGAA